MHLFPQSICLTKCHFSRVKSTNIGKNLSTVYNEDIDKLQKQINKLKIQAEIDPNAISNLASQIENVASQKITISGANIDQGQIGKIGQDIGNAISQGVSDVSGKAGDALKASVNKEAQNLEALKTKWKEQGLLTDGFVNKIKQLETALSKVSSKGDLKTFKTSLQSAQKEADKIIASGNSVASTIQKIDTEQKKLNKNSNSMFSSLKKGFSFLSYWTSFAHIMTSAVRGIKSMVRNVRELSDALTNISYTMDVTGSQLKEIGGSSLQMAKDLHTSASNILGAVKLYANAKETADSILAKSEPAVMLSNVTGITGEKSAKMLQSIMNQFDMTQDDLMEISDTIEMVSQNMAYDFSNGINEIANGIEISGSVAKSAGLNLQEYVSMLGLAIEKTGQSGSVISNAYKTIFQRITKASATEGTLEEDISAAEASLRAVGVEVRDTADEFRDLTNIMADLAKVWGSLSSVQQSNIAYNVAGVRQTNILKSLLGYWSDYESLVEKANDASGTTLQNQETYAESLSGTLGELSAIWGNISNDTIDSSFLKGIVDAGIAVSSLVEKIGLLKTVAGLGIVGFFNKGRSNTILPCMGVTPYCKL